MFISLLKKFVMSSWELELKQLEAFEDSLNKNNVTGPFIACSHIRKRTLINYQIDIRQDYYAQKMHIITSKDSTDLTDLREEIISNRPVLYEEFDDDVFRDKSNRVSIIKQIRREQASQKEFLDVNSIWSDSDSGSSDTSNNKSKRKESISSIKAIIESLQSDDDDDDEYDTDPEPFFTLDDETFSEKQEQKELCIWDDKEWLSQKQHIFVFSFAGKPIYSLHGHGNEDKMCVVFALMQCLIGHFQARDDCISSIHAEGVQFVFLIRNALYFVAVSREDRSVYQIKLQLSEVYNQILFNLNFTKLERFFKERPNYDLRKQLAGHELVISSNEFLVSNEVFLTITNSIGVMPLDPDTRSEITNIIQSKCSKIKNMVFALLITDHELIALVRLKNYTIHPADLRLIFNSIKRSEETIKRSKLWLLQLCLPKFDMFCFLYAYIACISDNPDVYLILISHDTENVSRLCQAHEHIATSLNRTNCMQHESLMNKIELQALEFDIAASGIPGLWHFLYKPKSSPHQLLCPKIIPPYTRLSEFKRLVNIYRDLYNRIHSNNSRQLKLIFEVKEKEVAIAHVTNIAEIYAIFDPVVNKISIAKHFVDILVKLIKKDQGIFFIKNYPTF